VHYGLKHCVYAMGYDLVVIYVGLALNEDAREKKEIREYFACTVLCL